MGWIMLGLVRECSFGALRYQEDGVSGLEFKMERNA